MILSVISNFLHLLATVTWIGGMLFVNLVLMPSLTAIDPPQRGKLMGAIAKRFAILSWGSIVILLVTGVIVAPSQSLLNLSTAYGVTLFLKHLAVLAMIVIGVRTAFVIAPKMQSLAPAPGTPPSPAYLNVQKQFSLLARVNMLLGVLVLLLVAIL